MYLLPGDSAATASSPLAKRPVLAGLGCSIGPLHAHTRGAAAARACSVPLARGPTEREGRPYVYLPSWATHAWMSLAILGTPMGILAATPDCSRPVWRVDPCASRPMSADHSLGSGRVPGMHQPETGCRDAIACSGWGRGFNVRQTFAASTWGGGVMTASGKRASRAPPPLPMPCGAASWCI